MSFYDASILHPTVVVRKSGRLSAGDGVWTPLGGSVAFPERFHCPSGVWLKNESDTAAVYVRQRGSVSGAELTALEDRFYPVNDIVELEVAGVGASVSVGWNAV